MLILLSVTLAADLIVPFVLAPFYKGYSHLRQVMSVLGNRACPVHAVYNTWLVILGAVIVICGFRLYSVMSGISVGPACALYVILIVYAAGGCIVSGIFPAGKSKSDDTVSAKIHGAGAASGFTVLLAAPAVCGVFLSGRDSVFLTPVARICFVLAAVFFALFVMADKPVFKNTAVSFEGLWQRLSLLFMYVPVIALCLSFAAS